MGYVYYLTNKDKSIVKVGYSKHKPELGRLGKHRLVVPDLEVHACLPGTYQLEARARRELEQAHATKLFGKEWFEVNDNVKLILHDVRYPTDYAIPSPS